MGTIVVVGLGPGDADLITRKAQKALTGARRIFVRTAQHASIAVLHELHLNYVDFDAEYQRADDFTQLGAHIAQTLRDSAQDGDIVYAVPGQGMLGDETVRALLDGQTPVELIPGVDEGVSLLPAGAPTRCLAGGAYTTLPSMALTGLRPIRTLPLLITQLDSALEAAQAKLWLTQFYGDEQRALYGVGGSFREIALYELDRQRDYGYQALVLVPPIEPDDSRYDFYDLVDILARLRAPGGCPWDREQTHETLKDCLLEETYEVHEAIDDADMDSLCDELGDVLLQVVFHAQIGREHAAFDADDVTDAVSRKMIRRHPHIFAGK
ncbi:MAG: MazG nucleotide pyrophosphohydrolase domain-containing protein, partial [Eubacteriales bacterium]|nr:MazG nucleotide pyrophosphohydrolase domain-containing protein [Eubacteriales bacterium]